MSKIIRSIIVFFAIISSILCLYCLLPIAIRPYPKFIIHKTINSDPYDIIIISIRKLLKYDSNRELYAIFWLKNEKISCIHLCHLDAVQEYNEKIKSIVFSPSTSEIKVEFFDPENSKTRTGVDHYKLP